MGILRANVRTERGWWEIRLLDLDIVADGATEQDMLRQLEHSMTAEYHLALKHGQTPFVKRLLACPKDVSESWQQDDKKFRLLELPSEVRQALSAVFQLPNISTFRIEQQNAA